MLSRPWALSCGHGASVRRPRRLEGFATRVVIKALTPCRYLVDQFGRRAILILGALGGGISMIIIVRRRASPALTDSLQGAFNAAKDPANDKSVAGSAGGNMAIAFFYIVRRGHASLFSADVVQWTAFYSVSWNGTPWVCTSLSPVDFR